MDRNQAKEFYPILQAYAEGKTIETRRKPTTDKNGVTKDGWFEFNDWTEMKELQYWVNVEYRIKPEPKCRPFANAEECWAEMQKHQPFGWIKHKKDGDRSLITNIDKFYNISLDGDDNWSFDKVMKRFTFADGLPFGVKVEE
nr:MAG TPA: hypothetical protein [Crassvirales sp.]